MANFEVPTLVGEHVRLEPLHDGHIAGIQAAVSLDRSTYTYLTVPTADEVQREVSELIAQRESGSIIPFVQIDVRDESVAGMTRFMNIRSMPNRDFPFAVEIGGTWVAPSAQRTGVNTNTKYLLLSYAFEKWCVDRVDLKSDERNVRSRTAIERIGGKFEGILRGWQPSQVAGEELRSRNTAMYSIIASEWPQVKQKLEGLLSL